MKNLFFEYYNLDPDKIKNIWENGVIVFDTNTLINLYRYTEKTRNDYFDVMNHYKSRIWIPYQVALEYHSNRLNVISKVDKAYDQLTSQLTSELDIFIKKLDDFKRHPYINVEDIKTRIRDSVNAVVDDIKKINNDNPKFLENDIILNFLTDLFDGNVGRDFESDRLNEIYSEGKKRYQAKTPPGYCDENIKKDAENRKLYGDLILWKQIIEKSKIDKKDIIFITDDLKEDWWLKICGKTIGPRFELLKEFCSETGQCIIIYNADRFLKYALDNMSVDVHDETIEEVENTRKEDEYNVLKSHVISNDVFVNKPWGINSSILDLINNKHANNLNEERQVFKVPTGDMIYSDPAKMHRIGISAAEEPLSSIFSKDSIGLMTKSPYLTSESLNNYISKDVMGQITNSPYVTHDLYRNTLGSFNKKIGIDENRCANIPKEYLKYFGIDENGCITIPDKYSKYLKPDNPIIEKNEY